MTVSLSFIGGAGWQFFDNNGNPLSGGKIYTYAAGTSTPLATFTSITGLTPNANPIVLDSAGRTPEQIWVTNGGLYKYVVADSFDVVIRTWDNVGEAVDLAAPSGSNSIGFIQAGTGAVARSVQIKLREFVSVKDFGAVGDGVTDDTAAIQAALNIGPLAQIEFPAGVYVTGPLTVGPNRRLVGRGMTVSQLKLKSGSAGALLSIVNGTHTTLQDIGLDGNKTNCPSGTSCVAVSGAEIGGNGLWFINSGFFNAKTFGIYQAGTYSKANVIDCVVEGCDFDGIALTTATESLLRGNRCVLNGRFGILVQADRCRVEGNVCQNNGAVLPGGAGIGVVSAEFVTVSGNNCFGNTGHGIQFNDVSSGVQSSNVCHSNTISGLDCYASSYCTVSNNISYLNTVRGIEVDSASYYVSVVGNIVYRNLETGISVYRSPNTTVMGNHAMENGSGGSNRYGIRLWDDANTLPSSNCRIIGNNCSDDRGGSATQTYGISIENNATGLTFIGNKLTPNLTGAVNLSGGSIAYCEGNQGYAVAPFALTLQNSWVAFDVNWSVPASYVDASGVVFVNGSMKNGTTAAGTVVATLPVGQRPAKVEGPFITYANGGFTSFYVLTNGDIVAQSTLNATTTGLSGITFKAA